MSTIARQDFSDFLAFVGTFSLESVAKDPAKTAVIRRAHTQFLALLTTSSELLSDAGSAKQAFSDSYTQSGEKYLSEAVSDCSEFIMCVLLGLFRSAGGTLRSAIESYLKTFSAAEQPLILKRTSVPDVFNDAAAVGFFSSAIGKKVIAELKGIYGHLNAGHCMAAFGQLFRHHGNQHAQDAVQFIHIAIGGDAPVGFGDPLAAEKTRFALLASAGVNFHAQALLFMVHKRRSKTVVPGPVTIPWADAKMQEVRNISSSLTAPVVIPSEADDF